MNIVKKNTILTCIFILGIISILNLYNAKYLNINYSYFYIKQIIFFITGFTIIYFNKITKLITNFKYLYFINILLLFLVLIFGKSINGSKAWLSIGFISFQPSELMKFLLPLSLNNVLNKDILKFKKLTLGIIYTLIPSILVFLEPDTGAIIFYLIFLIIFIIRLKLNYKYYLSFACLLIIIMLSTITTFIYNPNILLKIFGSNIYYRLDRLINFKNNYQLDLSLISIYSSNLFRNGFNNIKIYIPEGHTDFMFSFCIGSYGLIMAPLIIILYLLIIINLYKNKTSFIQSSFIYMLLFQVLINILMNIGLMPIIGINLPFLSYGGSNLIIYFIYLSYILNMDNSY